MRRKLATVRMGGRGGVDSDLARRLLCQCRGEGPELRVVWHLHRGNSPRTVQARPRCRLLMCAFCSDRKDSFIIDENVPFQIATA